jgi:acyl-CoA thioester hydrolase
MSGLYEYKTKVYYEDTDAGGIVYYANYLKFIERARTEMIYQQLKKSHQQLREDHDVIFIVRTCNTKYLKPAKFEDELYVHTKVIKKSPVRINLLQEIKRKDQLLVLAEVEMAIVNNRGKIKKLPDILLKKL